jgi:hypothetical protein
VITAPYLPPAPVSTISEIVRMVALMDTLALYDQFRALLGEEGAKRFAQTIGTMIEDAKNAVTKRDFVELRESFESHSGRLDAALAKLAEAQARTEERVGSLEAAVARLADAQARTEERVGRLEAAVAELAEAQARTEKSLRELTEIVKGLSARSDRHEGTLLELKFRDRLPSYLGLYLRRAKVLQPADLLDALEPRLERADVEDFLRADVLAQGLVDGAATYVIGEVSYTADATDVERAARRAALLRKADLPAVGLVACEAVHPQTIAYAREQGVRIWADGRLVDERPS